MRSAAINRKTAETDVKLTLSLDGEGRADIDTGVGFLNHMLTLFAAHGCFDLTVRCTGDLDVDAHHTTEDVGIALGQALAQTLGDKRGVVRYGDICLPMDEALVLCAVDLSGRACLRFAVDFPTEKIGAFDTELVEEFFAALTREAGMTLHLRKLDGTNSHHIAEAAFKGFGRALRKAAAVDPARANAVPSTKGVLV